MKDCCETESCCETQSCGESSCSGGEKCPMESCDCPVEGMTKLWGHSFRQAIQEAQVEVLKAKILKAWGPMLDQTADAVIETMGAVWASKVADIRAGEAKHALKERIRDLMLQEKKK